jgi:hypothetical protein
MQLLFMIFFRNKNQFNSGTTTTTRTITIEEKLCICEKFDQKND